MATLRIDDTTHEKLKKLAEKNDTSITDIVAEAVRAYEMDEFFRVLNAQFEALTPEERAEDAAETALWDNSLMDGLEDEPPYEDDRIARSQ